MTEAEKTEVVRSGRATLRQLTQGLLDGTGQLRNACRYILIHTGTDLEELPVRSSDSTSTIATNHVTSLSIRRHTPRSTNAKSSQSPGPKPRFGLPDGFIPRFHRYGRLVLLEENIYSLPDGKEFVPCRPTGTLASGRHLYALLSVAQFERGERGSVFIRLDGRVFDYSNGAVDPDRELFDTGHTIHDLERTGRYASPFSNATNVRRRKRKQKVKRARAVKA